MADSADGRYSSLSQMPVLDLQNAGQPAFMTHKGSFFESRFRPKGKLLATGGYDTPKEMRSDPDKKFHRVKASLVHVAQDRMHHAGGHVVRPQAGVAIAQSGVNDAKFFHGDFPPKGSQTIEAITYVDRAKQGIDRFSS